jgi:hypothetical protein
MDIENIFLYYDKSDQFEISITSASGDTTPNAKLNDNFTHTLDDGNIVDISSRIDMEGALNSVHIALRKGEADNIREGSWGINVTRKKVINGKFDAWVERTQRYLTSFQGDYSDQKNISIPGTAHYIITVGNYDYRNGKRNNTSSVGPTRDGR